MNTVNTSQLCHALQISCETICNRIAVSTMRQLQQRTEDVPKTCRNPTSESNLCEFHVACVGVCAGRKVQRLLPLLQRRVLHAQIEPHDRQV